MVYLRFLLGTTVLILMAVAALNYLVDPGAIYSHASADPNPYVKALRNAPNGLWWPNNSFTDRQIKRSLVQFAGGRDCVVVGSSREMQTGYARVDRTLRKECADILNLAVSSGGIEDEIALGWLAVRHGPPRKIVLGIDPWTFAFNNTARWTYYAKDYAAAAHELGQDVKYPASGSAPESLLSKLINIFNLEYTKRSLGQLLEDIRYGGGRFFPRDAPVFNPAAGGKYPVLLRDGSLIYSSDYISGGGGRSVPVGGMSFSDVEQSDSATQALESFLAWLQRQGIEPILLLTPFHPNVWAAPNSVNVRRIIEAETRVQKLALADHVKVIGTFRPDAAPCSAAEFYDFMHATTRCLDRLDAAK